MPKLIALLIFSLVINNATSQTIAFKIDSLKKVLQQHPVEDTIRLKLINSIASKYVDVNPITGIEYTNKAITLAKKLNDSNQLKKAYFFKGNNFHSLGDNIAAIESYLKCLELAMLLKHKVSIGQLANNVGNTYFDLSNYDNSLLYHTKSFFIFEEMKDTASMCLPLNGMGRDYMNLGNYSKAIECYFKVINLEDLTETFSASGSTFSNRGSAFSNIGYVYLKIGNFLKAVEYFEKAIKIFAKAEDKIGIAKALIYIGNAYEKMNNKEQALTYYQKSLATSKEVDYKPGIAENFYNIGVLYNEKGIIEEAYQFLKDAEAMFEMQANKYLQSVTNSEIGKLLLNAPNSFLVAHGFSAENRYGSSINLQMQSLKLATEIKHVLQQSIAWQQLSNVYELSGDYANALNAYKQFKVLQDSTIRGDREKEIKQRIMQSEFENEAALQNAIHEKKQAIAEGEIKNQRTTKQFIIGGSLIMLIALLVMFILYKRRRDAKTKQKEAEFKLQVADTETKVLRLQMNPHFIFNSLNSISDYIVKNNISEADSYLIKFAKLMRMTLEHSEQTSIPLSEELNALELYMQLECKRLNGKFSFVINIADDIDSENTMVPPLIFQPFIENSIWHGISKKDGKGNIEISISKKEGMLYCSIDDNGIGRINAAHNINKENKSLGMKITKARIEMLNSIKKTNAAVKLIDKPEGLTATISLPLELHF